MSAHACSDPHPPAWSGPRPDAATTRHLPPALRAWSTLRAPDAKDYGSERRQHSRSQTLPDEPASALGSDAVPGNHSVWVIVTRVDTRKYSACPSGVSPLPEDDAGRAYRRLCARLQPD